MEFYERVSRFIAKRLERASNRGIGRGVHVDFRHAFRERFHINDSGFVDPEPLFA